MSSSPLYIDRSQWRSPSMKSTAILLSATFEKHWIQTKQDEVERAEKSLQSQHQHLNSFNDNRSITQHVQTLHNATWHHDCFYVQANEDQIETNFAYISLKTVSNSDTHILCNIREAEAYKKHIIYKKQKLQQHFTQKFIKEKKNTQIKKERGMVLQ